MKNKIEMPYSSARLLVRICRAYWNNQTPEDAHYPDEWAYIPKPSEESARLDLVHKKLIAGNYGGGWANGQLQQLPTKRGLKIYA